MFVLSDRQSPLATSWFVMAGSRIVAQGRTWREALDIAFS